MPLLVVVPLLAAAILAALRPVLPRVASDLLAIAAAAVTAAMAVALAVLSARHGTLVYWFGDWRPHGGVAIGIAFAGDPAGAVVAATGAVLATAAFCYAWRYFDTLGTLFPTLILVFLAGVEGYGLSGDLFTLFVFFELMSTSAYALTGYKIEGPSLEGALTFAVVNSLGALMLLWGIALLYGRFGALNMAQLGDALARVGHPDGASVAALALLATGFLTKAAIVPFQFWHADADAVAPVPVCVLISGIMAPLGLYGLARVYLDVFSGAFPLAGDAWTVLMWLGAITALVGGALSLRQRHLKRLLAFSTIGHVGMMLCGLATANAVGFGGFLAYLGAHGLAKGSLFLTVGVVLHRLGSVDLVALRGRGRGIVWVPVLLGLGAWALAGLPPFATYAGKVLIEDGAHRAGPLAGAVLPWVLTLCSAMTAAAVLRALCGICFDLGPRIEEEDAPTGEDGAETKGGGPTPLPLRLAPAAMLLACAGFGLWPGLGSQAIGAAAAMLQVGVYRAAVLAGAPTEPMRPVPVPHGDGLLFAGVVLALTLLLTALHLFQDRLGAVPRAPLRWLETLHSGEVGDYVAWFAAGAAGLGAAFAAVSLG